MRNIVEYPVTVEEVTESLRKSTDEYIKAHAGQIGGIEGLALFYLNDFLKDAEAKRRMARFLDEVQPKPDPQADKLSKDELEVLIKAAYQSDFRTHVWQAEYRGLTKGGSATYDLNNETPRPVRLYVRRINGVLRGEINEENFSLETKPKYRPPQPSNKPPPSPTIFDRLRAWLEK